MKKSMLIGKAAIFVLLLTGCGPLQYIGPDHSGQSADPSNQPITFFQNALSPNVKLKLSPDPLVQMPNAVPPKRTVIVYLPIYPDSVSTKPISAIGDMGAPMDGDLVDGTLYFKSKDSQAQIKSWYANQFQLLGYTMNGQGQSGFVGNPTSDFFAFTQNDAPGSPIQAPDINLGFLTQKQGNETFFKLKASYIVTPTRPTDSYLSSDIVKVVLTDGKSTKTVTDSTWISHVTQMINSLQVSTPGISAGRSIGPGMIKTIKAEFYEQSGSKILVLFSLPFGGVSVGNSNVTLNSTPALEKDIESVLNKQ